MKLNEDRLSEMAALSGMIHESPQYSGSKFPLGYIAGLIEGTIRSSAPRDNGTKSDKPGYYTLGELLDRPNTEVPLLVAPLLQRQGVAMLAGSSDTGKSSFLRQLALDIILEKPTFLGFPIQAVRHSAICISTEDGDEAVGPLLKKQLLGQKVPDAARNRLRFVFDTEHLIMKLDSMLTQQPADLIIIDALGDLFDGNLNQSNEVRRFISSYSQLAIKHGCLILFMHHTGKRTEDQKPSKNNLLGSQGLEAKMRVVLELRTDSYNPALRHLCVLKGNYLPNDAKEMSYILHFDSNLTFHNTGERSYLGDLRKKPEEGADEREVWERARQLLGEGNSFERTASMLLPITESLGMKPISKSALARRLPKSTINHESSSA
ncbi:AAA family ATPase [Hymenobacter sp. ASUV-10]|uniref:AAA family ATPase n=1 Tax=Hymenobacter aranciens TaxID=3063996 RepID=A0ABT9B8Z7_9BACT|nr:AAA family ATPase [Hymenobacter sp. ASUV-10]MDO7874746.1 AAA family ATPase [Hymenobacter sp. ASUV-10]